MASSNIFRGDSLALAQQDTLPVGGAASNAGNVFSCTINRKVVSYIEVAGDTTNTILAASIAAALAASTIAEFAKITWTSSVANVIATGPATGEPLTDR